jgi:CHAT domain-containing protein/Tfp pilus assembly protein PilF
VTRSWICIVASWACFLNASAQEKAYPTDKLKLALTFGNKVVMAFDEQARDGQIGDNSKQASGMMPAEVSLNNGDHLYYQGRSAKAIDQYYEAVTRLVASPNNPSSGKGIDIFTISAMKDKRFTTAERLLKRVDRSTLDKAGWLTLATALNTTGIYYHQAGQINVAEQLYLKALEIQGAQAGKSNEYYVSSLHNLAVLRKDQGRYDAAEDMLKYVTGYYEKTKSRDSYLYRVALNNQAMLYGALGRGEDATATLSKLTSGFDPATATLDLARIMVNRALIEAAAGREEQALLLINQALGTFDHHDARKHPDYQQIRLILAQVQLERSRLSEANGLITEILDEVSKESGTDNLMYAHAMEIKGDYFLAMKDYAAAKDLFQKTATIRAPKLGSLHKDFIGVTNKLAICQWQMKDVPAAFQNFKVVTESYLDVVSKYFYNMSEKEKAQFWNELKPQLDAFYSFVVDQHATLPELLPFAYNLRLRTKGLLLFNANKIRNAINNQADQQLSLKFKEWISLKEQLSSYYSMDKETIVRLGPDIAVLETDANELEKEINRAVYGNDQFKSSDQVTVSAVAGALKEHEAAIEIIRMNEYPSKDFESGRYFGLLLKPGNVIQLINIGGAKELDKQLLVHYKNSIRNLAPESVTYERLWLPIKEHLADINRIFVSPDGIYNLVNLNSLSSKEGEYVIDRYIIEMVPNTGVLGVPRQDRSNSKVALIGNPSFAGREVSALPGTQKEIESIYALMRPDSAILVSGSQATEKALMDISRPRVLHVATHGFFLNDPGQQGSTVSGRMTSNHSVMLRSGLLLSRPESEGGRNSSSDGILTAFEATNMNLHNTDLVVLSACETGTGEVMNGEGVYGLQRAFTISGARNLIISLWKVDDATTQQLMTSFYTEWMRTGNLKASFVKSQKLLKESHPEPYYWAAFILVVTQ